MKEVYIALGLGLMLTSLGFIAWGAFGIKAVDRFDEFEEENSFDPWNEDDTSDAVSDRMRNLFTLALAGGVFLLLIGAALALRGWREVKSEAPYDALVIPAAPSGERSFCDYCGGPINPATVRCPACGRVLKGR